MAKIELDFDIIEAGNPYNLTIIDTSNWGIIKSKPAILEIIKPGEDLPITYIFSKNTVNVFNSNKLDEKCTEGCLGVDLIVISDGLYKITLKGSPDKFFKYKLYLKTDGFEMELSKLFIKYFTDCNTDKKTLENITEIKYLLMGAKSAVRFSNITLANSLWNKAVDKMEYLKNCLK